MKQGFLFIVCILVFIRLSAQPKVFSDKDYTKNPLWIEMIKDTTTNFFEVEKAYKLYFSVHKKHAGEHEIIGEKDKNDKFPTKKERKKLEQENKMRIEVKKYEHWHDMMLPYVQQNGHILTPSERLKIWAQQKSK